MMRKHIAGYLGSMVIIGLLIMPAYSSDAPKPRVWITTDIMEGDAGDEDDDVTMAAFLLFADHYQIEGIAVNANPGNHPGTRAWCERTFYASYKDEVGRLNDYYNGRYQTEIKFYQAATAGMKFKPIQEAASASNYLEENPTMKAMISAARKGPIYVLNWGPVTEVAMAVNYCIAQEPETLKNLTVVSHWTQRNGPWNCAADNEACDYLHDMAEKRDDVRMVELGPSGQQGMVEDFSGTKTRLDKETMLASKIGRHLNAKWHESWKKMKGMPDFSDGATFLVLMGFGGGFETYAENGIVPDQEKANKLLSEDRAKIFAMLEERAKVAAGVLSKEMKN